MDKYEYKIRADQIKTLIAQGEYTKAADIADDIDWRRVKSVMMLCMISDLYKINRRFEDAKALLKLAYDRHPGGRTIVYSLCDLSLKMGEVVAAVEYYKEFLRMAPRDTGRYILQYKLYEAQEVSLEERIAVLDELKKRDYREKWAFELAWLCHRVGQATRCVEECDELILWFGEGKYVTKAMELKMLHQPLSPEQQEKYDARFRQKSFDMYQGEASYSAQEEQFMEEAYADEEVTHMERRREDHPSEPTLWNEDIQSEAEQIGEQFEEQEGFFTEGQDIENYREPTKRMLSGTEVDIHVKTMDVGQYNTINLQKELAEGLREVLDDSQLSNANEEQKISEEPPVSEASFIREEPPIREGQESFIRGGQTSEVFFGETDELSFQPTKEKTTPKKPVKEDTAELVMRQLRQEKLGIIQDPKSLESPLPVAVTTSTVSNKPTAESMDLPRELAEVLAMESDGQIKLVVPEANRVEKQITGQLSIEDILSEWERMKKDNEEKRKEAVRQRVLQHTDSMFSEFEASVRDGLLEQLENDKNLLDETPVQELEKVVQEDEFVDELKSELAELTEELEGGFIGDAEEESLVELENEFFENQEYESTPEPESELTEESESGLVEEPESVFTEELESELLEEPEGELTEELESELLEGPDSELIEELDSEFMEEPDSGLAEELDSELIEESDSDLIEEPESGLTKESEKKQAEESEDELIEIPESELISEPEDDDPSYDKGKARSLSREEKELYGPYIQSKAAREQLVEAIDNISMAAYTGNVIITGEEGIDTMTLAKNMIREVQMNDSNFLGKTAKISGESLNKKEVSAILSQLKNGALIIQKASGMNDKTVKAMLVGLQRESLGIIVIMEDNKKSINKMLSEHPGLDGCFTARMHVEGLSNDTLVAFGRKYAKEREYVIDDLGILALHTRIAEKQTSEHAVTVIEVQQLVDDAIQNANRKTIGHFFDILLAKRYDDEDMIILRENDFMGGKDG